MSIVHKRLFKTFMVHFNRAFRNGCRVYKPRNDGYDPMPFTKTPLVSWTYCFHWMPNHQWNGGHMSQLFFRLIYDTNSKMFRIMYRFDDEHLDMATWFDREISFDYIKWCRDKKYSELLQMVFPFYDKDALPTTLETPFDDACNQFAQEQALQSRCTYETWKNQHLKAIEPVVTLSKPRANNAWGIKHDKPSAEELDARAEYLDNFDVRQYLLAHPRSHLIFSEMSVKIFKAGNVCKNQANKMLDR